MCSAGGMERHFVTLVGTCNLKKCLPDQIAVECYVKFISYMCYLLDLLLPDVDYIKLYFIVPH